MLSDSTFDLFGDEGLDQMNVMSRDVSLHGLAQTIRGGDDADKIGVLWNNVAVMNDLQTLSADIGVYGDLGDDAIRFLTDGTTGDGDSSWSVDGGDGNDTMNVRRSGEQLVGNSSLSMNGDAGDDTIHHAVDGWSVNNGLVNIGTGDGDDEIDLNLTNVEIDNGSVELFVDGGNDNDTVTVSVHFDPGSIGSFQGVVLGGAGDDNVSFSLFAPPAVTIIQALLDGGTKFDTCQATANVQVINCEA